MSAVLAADLLASDVWPFITRSSGIVATVLIVAALGGGLLFSGRATGSRRRPNWWLDLHNYLGGLAFAFTALHVVASFRDQLSGIGLLQIFVPMTATGATWAVTWGVLALYAFAAVVFTSWPGKRFSRRAWLAVHLTSLPATFMVAAHAWMLGSDRGSQWFDMLLALLTGLAVYPAVLRVNSLIMRRRRGRGRPGAPPAATATSVEDRVAALAAGR